MSLRYEYVMLKRELDKRSEDFQKVSKVAKRFKSRSEFHRRALAAYTKAWKNGWLDDVCKHMVRLHLPNNYWSFQRVEKEAAKYKSLSRFREKSSSCYSTAKRNGWVSKVTRHMSRVRRPNGYWNYEEVLKEAKRHKTKLTFRETSPGAYDAAQNNKWMDRVCEHMNLNGSPYRRAIYAFEFSDRSVYVGLTFNYEQRYEDHLRKGIVSKKIKSTKAKFIRFNVWHRLNQAIEEEGKLIRKYRDDGWIILNRVKPGGLGGAPILWNYYECKKIVSRFKYLAHFRKKYPGAYGAILKNNWKKGLCSHLQLAQKPHGYWTFKRVSEEALKYKTRTEFQQKSKSAWSKARSRGWLDKVCRHMIKLKKPSGYWTYQRVLIEAKKYKTRSQFHRKSVAAAVAGKHGWLESVCRHMPEHVGHWTFGELQKEAKKYKTRSEFYRNYPSACVTANAKGWMDDICKHMPVLKVPNGYWTLERTAKEAKKFKTRTEFQRKRKGAYSRAYDEGWLPQITKHMPIRA